MAIYDANGNIIDGISKADIAFDVKKVNVGGNVKIPYYGDGLYACNPFLDPSIDNPNVTFYDANDNFINVYDENGNLVSHSTLGLFTFQNRITLQIVGTAITAKLYLSYAKYIENQPSNIYHYTLEKTPVKIKFSHKVTYNICTDKVIPDNVFMATYRDGTTIGLFEQINGNTEAQQIANISNRRNEWSRRMRSEMIYQINDTRHAMRIASYNVKGSGGFGQNNWYMLKECLQNYGINICGMQEVMFPLKGTAVNDNKTFAEYFESWQFPYISDNGDAYRKGDGEQHEGLNERMLLSAYPIDSTEETMFTTGAGSDYRYWAKSVISLPRYMDKRGSENLKLSVYNTQLEVQGAEGGVPKAQLQAQELLEIVQADENPFIIIMGDMNDFSINKGVYEIFKNGGFTPVTDTNTSTVSGTYDYNSIDNFFLSSRIKALDWNVVWSQEYFWSGTYAPTDDYGLSDHDFIYADVQLDYSDIRCINFHLTGVTATVSNGKTWMTDEETVTITLTADEGKTLGAITVKDCMLNNAEAITVSGNTITLDGSKLIGDVLITATAT